MRVPYLDMARLHEEIKRELVDQFEQALEVSDFILGPSVERFESEFSAFSQMEHCVGVSSGTSAIQLTLEALGVGPGDEVIVPANSFTATAAAAARTQANVIFADVDPISRLITPQTLQPLITHRTRAIIPVHLHGNVADVKSISEVAGEDVYVIEDCAQAHGARFFSYPVGTFSTAATFSFYPGKNLGALGDAGAITTNSSELATNVGLLRNWGEIRRPRFKALGYNERLDAIQARFLSVKLARLPYWEARRNEIAKLYNESLSSLSSLKVPDSTNPGRVWHVYAIEVADRDALMKQLAGSGIETKVHYSKVIPDQLPYSLSEVGFFPVARSQARQLLSLPIDPLMTKEDAEYVVTTLKEVLS